MSRFEQRLGPVIQAAPVRYLASRARRRARPVDGTLLLTTDELLVVVGPADAPTEVLMRQGRADLAMARWPTSRGGEEVELSALDGQEATLRFDRRNAAAAAAIAGWLAGLPA
jgi:hypothetical protein